MGGRERDKEGLREGGREGGGEEQIIEGGGDMISGGVIEQEILN